MKGMGSHSHRHERIEALLSDRPRAPRHLVSTIALQVERTERVRGTGARVAMASAATLSAFVAAGVLGGVGSAASSVTKAADAVKTALSSNAQAPAAGNGEGANAPAGGNSANNAAGSSGNGSGQPGGNTAVIAAAGNQGNGIGNGDGNPHDPDNDQYKPGKGCGDKNHVHFKEGQCK
jgi:hypothetical protein